MNTKGKVSKFGPSSRVMAASQNLEFERLELRVTAGALGAEREGGRGPWSNTAGARE